LITVDDVLNWRINAVPPSSVAASKPYARSCACVRPNHTIFRLNAKAICAQAVSSIDFSANRGEFVMFPTAKEAAGAEPIDETEFVEDIRIS
jgi:hypothetical protein